MRSNEYFSSLNNRNPNIRSDDFLTWKKESVFKSFDGPPKNG